MVYNPVQTNEMPFKEKLLNGIWGIVNKTLFRMIPPYTHLFKKMKVLLLRLFGADVAWSANIHSTARIEYPWNFKIGHLSSIGENSWVYAMNKITIGSKTCIGKNVNLITGSHNISSATFNLITDFITIGNNVWITTGVYILPGVNIGDYAVVSVNSVITKSISKNDIVGGNPARFIKKREIIIK